MDVKESGWIYILSNPAIPSLVKIGRTAKQPEDRAVELSRPSGVPSPFKVKAVYSTGDTEAAIRAERSIHQQLDMHRSNQGREFFHLSVTAAIKLVEECLKYEGVDVNASLWDQLFSLFDTTGVTLDDLYPTGDRKLGVEDGRAWPRDAAKGQCEAVLNLDRGHPHFHYLMTLYADSGLQKADSPEYVIGFHDGVRDYAAEIERRIMDREWEQAT